MITGVHEALGGRMGEVAGVPVPRSYGDPAAEYAAIRQSAGLVHRADRVPIRASGRDPVKMVQGLITNDLAGAPAGRGVYAAVLTPKGKMVADLRVFRRASGDLLLDVDVGARDALLAHLRHFVPPLFARFQDLGAEIGVLGVYGPRAPRVLADALGGRAPEEAAEEAFEVLPFGVTEVLAARTGYAGEAGYDLFVPAVSLEALWSVLSESGARPVGHAALEVLRIEAGRPRWGAGLDEGVIPLEAALRDRAISDTKGCYTGQEVIIRILHRGHVNRHLRGLLLGDAPDPPRRAALVRPEDGKVVGHVTSACESPRLGQTIALGYVRREVEPPAELRLETREGAVAMAVELPFLARA